MEDEKQFDAKPNVLQLVWASVASVGWYVVGVFLVLAYSWPYISEKYNSWKNKKNEHEYAEKYHKDPDLVHERLTKIEEARQRMQEKYNKDLEIAKQKEQELRERKLQEALKKSAEMESGHRLGTAEDKTDNSTNSKSSRLRKEDYNPLSGGSGARYRPPKRSCCGSGRGGCG